MTSNNNISSVLKGINKYIRKYYLFKLLTGLVVTFSLVSIIYLLIVIIQYYFYLPVNLKSLIFWSFLALIGFILFEFVLINALKLFKITKHLSNIQAAKLISDSFTEIKDQLLNILELHEKGTDNVLVQAAISKKISNIKFFDFSSAIKFKSILNYFKYFGFPLLILFFVLVYNKSILSIGNKKFLDYNVYYHPVAPFNFVLLNDDLTVQTGTDLVLNLKIEGDIIPEQVFIIYGSSKIPLVRSNKVKNNFTYTLKSINKEFNFSFYADGFYSDSYVVNVLPAPSILDYTVSAVPPSYTHKSSFTLKNKGDILVPIGTEISYVFNTQNVDTLLLFLDTINYKADKFLSEYKLNFIAKSSSVYKIIVKNSYFNNEIFNYNLTVIPDLFPKITINTIHDSISNSKYYFKGYISDDYGFTNLSFNYSLVKDNIEPDINNFSSINIDFLKNSQEQEFYFWYDFIDLVSSPDLKLYYFFAVTDNDAYTGFKTSKTQLFMYSLPTRFQIDSAVNDLDNQVQDKIDLAQQLAFDIQQDIQNFNERMINENVSDWEKQNFLNNLLQKQQSLNSMIDELKQNNDDKINQLQQIADQNEDLLNKQKLIQDMLDNLLSDDMKDMLDSLQKMQDDFNSDNFNDLMNNLQQDNQQLSDNLDRSLELLKKMQVEQELQNTVDQLNKLSDHLQKLSENIDKTNDITSAQEDSILTNESEFQDLMNNYDSLLNKNSYLDNPMDLDSLSDQMDNIQKDFDKAKDQMFKDQQNKTSKSLKKTSQDMQELSDQMSNMMSSNMQQSHSEDMQMIKFLLTNLLTFSFKQETIYNSTSKNISVFSEFYKDLMYRQLKIKDDFKIIFDSLSALARRNPMVGSVILNEVNSINNNLNTVNSQLNTGDRSNASINQRYIITSANKLALMLQESLQQIQNQMSMPGSGQPKPGNKPMPSLGDLKQMQDAMKQQLQQMMQQMQNGQMPGSQQFGMQLAQREAMQKMLQDMLNSGDLTPEMQQLVEEMMKLNDDIKNDVINKQITPTTIQRDKEITTRMLDAQNADNQRKKDNKRQSTSADNIDHSVPDDVINLFNNTFEQNDILSKKAINLNIYLKNYYNGYVHRLEN